MSVNELLANDEKLLRSSSYPTECLNPYEAERFYSLELPEERIAHVETRPMCTAVLDAAKPNDEPQQLISVLRRELANRQTLKLENKVTQQNGYVWEPLLAIVVVSLLTIIPSSRCPDLEGISFLTQLR